MEQRKHPRITLPLVVELHHPSIGHKRCVVRDVSEDGLFVILEDAAFKKGSKLKLTLLNPSAVEQQATPTIDMQVNRIDPNGVALQFANRTSAHLWSSVKQLRQELEIGRDFFQVHQSLIILDQRQQLLLVQQQGRWMFPGRYLQVGDNWSDSLITWLEEVFGLTNVEFISTVTVSNQVDPAVPEAATLKLFHQYEVNSAQFKVPLGYKNCRWIDHTRGIEELTFAQQEQRPLAIEALRNQLTAHS